MGNKLIEIFMFPILFLVLLLDGQLSTLITNWSFGLVAISSHVLLMLAIYYANYVSMAFSLFIFSILGLIYDISYLGLVGIATTIFPLAVYSIYFFFQGVESRPSFNTLILLVVVFEFEFISFLFARIFHMTNLSVFIFVFNKLLPSLLFNLLLFLILQPLFGRLFGITNKT